jgi:hypothetical protein
VTYFWDVAPYSLAEVVCVESIAEMMEKVRTSETSVYCKEITRRYIPESRHLRSNLSVVLIGPRENADSAKSVLHCMSHMQPFKY